MQKKLRTSFTVKLLAHAVQIKFNELDRLYPLSTGLSLTRYNDHLPVGLIPQLVEHCTGITSLSDVKVIPQYCTAHPVLRIITHNKI